MFDAKAIPDAKTLSDASSLEVLDSSGNRVPFGSLFESEKIVLVFIRHFFCGSCQDYVTQLSTVRKEALEEARMKIVVIGCGDWQPIESYTELTEFKGPIYADPSRKLYTTLGMTLESLASAPAGEPKKSYISGGALALTFRSIWKGPVKNPALIGKQGNISQLGGDFVFGPGMTCSFANRMQHTEDHIEVPELMKTAGVAYP